MTHDFEYSFGAWIRRRRKALDLTQLELAERLHCSVNTIKKLETDTRRPSKPLAELLALQLNIPEEQRQLFIECARGLRPVDALQHPDSPHSASRHSAPARPQPDIGPALDSALIGRETELSAVMRLLRESRLVTITGPGGAGKSSLAQAVLAEFKKHGIRGVFVPLVGLDSAGHIPLAVLSALGLTPEADSKQQVHHYLRSKKMLLVLDNFEHLLEGASFLGEILQEAADVTILATSRERLRWSGEQVFPLQGLRYPEKFAGGDPNIYPAVSLFLAAARKLRPDFEPADVDSLIQICSITEGMPLALEMSAAWIDTLSLSEIVAELRQSLDLLIKDDQSVGARHRSMRAVFDSSWQLLHETERSLFSRLCIFRAGFTRQAAEFVGAPTPTILATLVRRSLIRLNPASGRYSIHELLRMYGEEQLKMSPALDEMHRSHLQYFLQMAETAQTFLHKAEQFEWFKRLDEEQDNLRAALSFSLAELAQAERAVRLVLALCWYWRIRSRVVEARKWVEQALRIEPLSVEMRARLNFHAGHFGWMQDDLALARTHQHVSLRLWQSLGVDGMHGAAYSHLSLGMIADHEQSSEEALEHTDKSIGLFKECQDEWGVAFARHILGAVHLALGDLDQAQKQFQQSEEYFRGCGDRWALGLVLGFIARIEFRNGNLDRARSLAEEARTLREEFGHIHSVIDSLDLLARIALKQGDKDTARALIVSAISIADELGINSLWRSFRIDSPK